MKTVKRYCEDWGQEHHISMTAENLIADIRARNKELEDVLRRYDAGFYEMVIKVLKDK